MVFFRYSKTQAGALDDASLPTEDHFNQLIDSANLLELLKEKFIERKLRSYFPLGWLAIFTLRIIVDLCFCGFYTNGYFTLLCLRSLLSYMLISNILLCKLSRIFINSAVLHKTNDLFHFVVSAVPSLLGPPNLLCGTQQGELHYPAPRPAKLHWPLFDGSMLNSRLDQLPHPGHV